MTSKPFILGIVVVGIVVVIALLQRGNVMPSLTGSSEDVAPELTVQAKEGTYPRAQELTSIAGYLNSEPFKLSEYVGIKVILIDFWTYSCINCQRTFPYLREWWSRYEDDGLLIVGVHTPEFEFEKERDNVQAALGRFGIDWPVVLDNDYATWRAYRNQYWPRKYLIDVDGYIVYDHIGEGGYEETERQIQRALAELHERMGTETNVPDDIVQPTDTQDVEYGSVGSPEVYFGAFRNQSTIGNGTPGQEGTRDFSLPSTYRLNRFYLGGTWDIEREYATNRSGQARVVFRYQARSVNIVAGSDTPVRITILRDGEPIGMAAGRDVNDGHVVVEEETLYNIIDDPDGYGEHTLELIIEEPGLQLFTFTFG